MTLVPAFGPAETVTVADLAEGDFLIEIPAQHGYRAAVVQAGVRTITEGRGWTRSGGYRRRRDRIRSRKLTYQMGQGGHDLPVDWTVTVQRPQPVTTLAEVAEAGEEAAGLCTPE